MSCHGEYYKVVHKGSNLLKTDWSSVLFLMWLNSLDAALHYFSLKTSWLATCKTSTSCCFDFKILERTGYSRNTNSNANSSASSHLSLSLRCNPSCNRVSGKPRLWINVCLCFQKSSIIPFPVYVQQSETRAQPNKRGDAGIHVAVCDDVVNRGERGGGGVCSVKWCSVNLQL